MSFGCGRMLSETYSIASANSQRPIRIARNRSGGHSRRATRRGERRCSTLLAMYLRLSCVALVGVRDLQPAIRPQDKLLEFTLRDHLLFARALERDVDDV